MSPHADENPLIPEEEVAAFVDDARMEAFEKTYDTAAGYCTGADVLDVR